MTDTLPVSEIFCSFQGEGPSAGRRCAFVRLGHCNLHCAWCDADYTWRYSLALPPGYTGKMFDPDVELTPMTADEIAGKVAAMGVEMIVITGGEPLLHAKKLPMLLHTLYAALAWPVRVEMETNGTLPPPHDCAFGVDRWNVSPKLENSGNDRAARYKPDALRAFEQTGKAVFKFVVTGPDDLAEVDTIVAECGLANIWLMPEGCDPMTVNAHAQSVAEAALARGWNMTMRMQVALWGSKRGV